MKITDKDINNFEALSSSETGMWLVDFLERLKVGILDPETLSKDNVEARKEAIKIIREEIIERIQLVNKDKQIKKEDLLE